MGVERASVLAGASHRREKVGQSRNGGPRQARRRSLPRDRVERFHEAPVVFEGRRIDREHAGRIADTENPLARKKPCDPSGWGRHSDGAGSLFGLVTERPEPSDGGHALGAFDAEFFGEFMPLRLVASIAPEAGGADGTARRVHEHLAMHLS